MNKYLFVIHPELLHNFPKLFRNKNSKTIVYGFEKSKLSHNKFVDEYREIKVDSSNGFIDEIVNSKKLLAELNGLILWGDDEIMFRIAKSNLPKSTKLKILPVTKEVGLEILGSKIGQTKVSSKLKLQVPKSKIILSKHNLKSTLNKFHFPYIIKADRLGGGAFVRKVSSMKDSNDIVIDDSWFPLVIQEFIDGNVISVEAFFKNGKIVAWMYSDFKESLGDYGPSYLREYKNPPTTDFEDDLTTLAEYCGLTGMFNCTFIFKDSKHYLIEFDGRPNSWHFLYAYFKLPIIEIFEGVQEVPIKPFSPKFTSGKTKLIIDLDRSFNYAIITKNKKILVHSLLNVTNSTQWIARNYKYTLQKAVIAIAKFYLFNPRKLIFNFFVTVFRRSPESFQSTVKNLGITKFVASKIFRF